MDSRQEKLSAVQWSWMRDPQGFEQRMQERAERLHDDKYFLEPDTEVGVFHILRFDSRDERLIRHTCNLLMKTCTCEFAMKAEVPVPCKHLLGAVTLAEAMIVQLTDAERYCQERGEHQMAMERSKTRQDILEAVNALQDALMCQQYEQEDEGRAFIEECVTERAIRETGYCPF